ncbi:MAG: TIGR02099 family protein [Gammaproteobacteria bacterium]|nr:TIGR02099 family protein [Gammaproteobacteria bacterium]
MVKKKLRRYLFHVGRWTWYTGATVLLLLVVGFTTARLLLPQLAERKDEIEAAINRVSPHAVRIEKLSTYWDGLHPGLHVHGLQVFAADRKTTALRLEEVRISLTWWPLLRREFEINNLEISRPALALERLADGRFRLAGFDPVRPTDEDQGENFLHWLFRQGRIAIIDGELAWRDRRAPGPPLQLSKVNLTLRNNGERHRLELNAVFPPALCRECSLTLDITGNPLAASDWGGEIDLRAGELNVEALPQIARERLPAALAGRFDVRLRTRWKNGMPQRVAGQTSIAGLVLPLKGLSTPLTLRELRGDLVWKAADKGWQLDLTNLMLGLRRPAWAADTLRVAHGPDEHILEAGHVDLADLTALVEDIRNQHELLQWWSELKPSGALNKFKLQLTGDWNAPTDFALKARLDNVGVQSRQRAPGVRGLSGFLIAGTTGGEFVADSDEIALTLPDVFRGPLEARRLRGRLAWEKRAGDWEFSGERLRLAASGGQLNGDFTLNVPRDSARSPTLRIDADFKDLDGAQAARYYPVRHLARTTLAWMERSFVGGQVTKGHLFYDGPVREFPFSAGNGRFEIRAQVRDGVYSFLPGWLPVRQAEAEVTLNRDQVRITGQGRIGSLTAKNVIVQTQRGPDGREEVHVRGDAAGPVDEALQVLHGLRPDAEAAAWTRYLPAGLRGGGAGALKLEVAVPFDDAPARVTGEYRFRNAALRDPDTGTAVEALDGPVRFDEHGVRDGQLRGRFLGGDATLVALQEQGRLVMHGQGHLTSDGLGAVLGPRLAPQLSGVADWRATWRAHKGASSLQAGLGLQTLKTRLPAPLNFPDGLPVEKLILKTESAAGDSHVLTLSAGNRVTGRLVFQRQAGGWLFSGGRIAFGDVPGRTGAADAPGRTSAGRGLHVSAQLDALDLDPLFPLLGQEGREAPAWLTRVSADVHALEFLDRPFGRVTVELAHEKTGWSGSLSGAAATGRVNYARRGSETRIDLDLAALNLPARVDTGQDVDVDPHRLPALTVKARAFQLKDKPLGGLDFAAQPTAGGWRVTRLDLVRPDTRLAVTGDWRLTDAGHQSEFDVRLASSDIGKMLEALGIPEQMSGGEVNVASHLTWSGSPADLRMANLSGRAEITAEKGRFLQLKQGTGRFFGVLDLSAIGRYLTLDFSPIFGQGFVFDRIHTQMTLERGNVYTDDLSIRGPSAKMNVRGRIGLAAEDFDLTLDLQPQLTDSLTLGSWAVFGPQVAAAVLTFQKIFKKEITETTRVSYGVKGPWDNPNVTRTLEEGKTQGKPKG